MKLFLEIYFLFLELTLLIGFSLVEIGNHIKYKKWLKEREKCPDWLDPGIWKAGKGARKKMRKGTYYK